jgi:hypothetical protein
VSPKLHQWCTADEPLSAFGGVAAAEWYCDRQFAVLPEVVLCFATLGASTGEPRAHSPSSLVWRPQRLDYDPSDEMPWLPEKVREVYDRSGETVKKVREHHLFLRTLSDTAFFYAGPTHLASYGSYSTGEDTWSGFSAHFELIHRLPADAWLKLGGYRGWRVELNHRTHEITAGDLPAFQRLVDELASQEFSHLCMTRYEEDSLTVHTNARRAWLVYLQDPADGGLYSGDAGYSGDEAAEEVFQCGCGIDLEFPASQTVSHALAAQAAVEFFQTGQLPRCVAGDPE